MWFALLRLLKTDCMRNKHFDGRGTATGVDYMRKPELIDAAEASGLSRAPIMHVMKLFLIF